VAGARRFNAERVGIGNLLRMDGINGASFDASINACSDGRECFMRTTLALDDEFDREGTGLYRVREKSALVREALKALIERESARRLARLGGTET